MAAPGAELLPEPLPEGVRPPNGFTGALAELVDWTIVTTAGETLAAATTTGEAESGV